MPLHPMASAAFADELVKAAEWLPPEKKARIKQWLKTTGVIAAGSGLGYASGRLAGDLAMEHSDMARAFMKQHPSVRAGAPLVAALGAGAMAASTMRDWIRDELLDKAEKDALKKGKVTP